MILLHRFFLLSPIQCYYHSHDRRSNNRKEKKKKVNQIASGKFFLIDYCTCTIFNHTVINFKLDAHTQRKTQLDDTVNQTQFLSHIIIYAHTFPIVPNLFTVRFDFSRK